MVNGLSLGWIGGFGCRKYSYVENVTTIHKRPARFSNNTFYCRLKKEIHSFILAIHPLCLYFTVGSYLDN